MSVNRERGTRAGTYCREGPGSEMIGLVNGILSIIDVGGRVGIDLVRRSSPQRRRHHFLKYTKATPIESCLGGFVDTNLVAMAVDG
jgi:hypothetical protein